MRRYNDIARSHGERAMNARIMTKVSVSACCRIYEMTYNASTEQRGVDFKSYNIEGVLFLNFLTFLEILRCLIV